MNTSANSTHEDAILESRLKSTGMITQEQLQRGLAQKNTKHSFSAPWEESSSLGEILVGQGYLSQKDLANLRNLTDFIPGYTLQQKIGEGKFGLVYKARQNSMDRAVAIKIINPRFSHQQAVMQRFFREIHALGHLSHPDIIHGIDCGSVGELHYLVMEYFPGVDLARYVKANGTLPQDDVLQIAGKLLSALRHIWERQLIHRDIAPENIMIDNHRQVKLCDLGLIRAITTSELQTTYNFPISGYAFMSPEQIQGRPLTFRSDVYSLGAVLYFALTASFPSENQVEDVQQRRIVPPGQRIADLDPHLGNLLQNMLSSEPERRCHDARQLQASFQSIWQNRARKQRLAHGINQWLTQRYEYLPLIGLLALFCFLPTMYLFSCWRRGIESADTTVTTPSPSQIFARYAPGVVIVKTGNQIGSGVITSYRHIRLILTNAHVVEDALKVVLIFKGGQQRQGEVIRSDKLADLALIAIPVGMTGLRSLQLAPANSIKVGDDVLVIGHPRGYDWSLTRGTVSAIRGEIIQTDAAINPGNSGGALLNSRGELIGITTFVVGKSNAIGFAISEKRLNEFLANSAAYVTNYVADH